jgi:hypothetical protein
MSKKAIMAVVAISLILASAVSGILVYYNGVVNEKNSKITSLNNQIASLNGEVSNLTAQSANLGALQANLTAANTEIANLTSQNLNLNNEIQNLKGQAANLESQLANLSSQVAILTTANIVTALGIREIPTTYQIDVGTTQYLSAPYNHLYIAGSVTNSGAGTAFNAGLHVVAIDANGVLQINMTVPFDNGGAQFGADANTRSYATQTAAALLLTSLTGTVTALININIFHEGFVSNWTVSPVWTNFP